MSFPELWKASTVVVTDNHAHALIPPRQLADLRALCFGRPPAKMLTLFWSLRSEMYSCATAGSHIHRLLALCSEPADSQGTVVAGYVQSAATAGAADRLDVLPLAPGHGPAVCNDCAFDGEFYLDNNPDVAAMGFDPASHYQNSGRNEGRPPCFDEDFYLAENPDVADCGLSPRQHYRAVGRRQCRHPAFDRNWYLDAYPDVAQSGVDPYDHYMRHGRYESRHPAFGRLFYMTCYPDIANVGFCPLAHYRAHGRGEGRHPGFQRHFYLARYADIRHCGMDPFEHFMAFGRAEGRLPSAYGDPLLYRTPLAGFPVAYDAAYQPRERFDGHTTDIKAVAFYLPQFHRSPHNDVFWGEGFTEWTNTRKARPRFDGHYQPRIPHDDIGYYDLADPGVLRRQAALAREHGLYGLCFYHYWFSGERVLDTPVETLLANPDIDIPFCLCWANENWTRTWDGLHNDVLLEQRYLEDDPCRFITDLLPFLDDPRYIRVAGRPVLLVYKAQAIPDFPGVLARWRETYRRARGGELLLWCCRTNPQDHAMAGLGAAIDGVVEFPPHVMPATAHPLPYMLDQGYMGYDTTGHFFDYRQLVDDITTGLERSPRPAVPLYRTVMLGWDNAARRTDGWSCWHGFSLERYHAWLGRAMATARRELPENQRFVFLNAWNEWAEGTYLEPDRQCGYAALNTTSRALFALPPADAPGVVARSAPDAGAAPGSIAVHLHLFFEELAEEMLGALNNIPYPFDLWITTDTPAKLRNLKKLFAKRGRQRRLSLVVTPNVGRDVGPFLQHILPALSGYDFIGHFHTKKSATVSWGDNWRRYLLANLLGSPDGVRAIFEAFAGQPDLGLFHPPAYPLIEPHCNWGENKDRCRALLRDMGVESWLPHSPAFPAGNMFWARTQAIRPMVDYDWSRVSFEDEAGQIANTLGHAVERLWHFVAAWQGMHCLTGYLREAVAPVPALPDRRRLVLFVHYDRQNRVSEADMLLVRALEALGDDFAIATNSELPPEELEKFSFYAQTVLARTNVGFDFGAWRDLLRAVGWDRLDGYDEIVFVNNSCYGPLFPLAEMFAAMAGRDCDFWGVTGFPHVRCSDRPEACLLPDREIAAHIQSYFFVVKREVAATREFYHFFESVPDRTDFLEAVAGGEVRLTQVLTGAGWRWDCYLPESMEIQRENMLDCRFNAPYNKPLSLLALRSPLIKKKAWGYAPQDMHTLRELVRAFRFYPPHLIRQEDAG